MAPQNPVTKPIVEAELRQLIQNLPSNSPIIGDIDGGKELCRMPRSEADGRKLSWDKLCGQVSDSVSTQSLMPTGIVGWLNRQNLKIFGLRRSIRVVRISPSL